MLNLGLPSGVVVTPITSQEESRWFESTSQVPFLCGVCMFPSLATLERRVISEFKLAMSVTGYLSVLALTD